MAFQLESGGATFSSFVPFQLQSGGLSFAGTTTFQLDSRGLSFSGIGLFQLESAGAAFSGGTVVGPFRLESYGLSFSGETLGSMSADNYSPNGGSIVSLAYPGDPNVLTTWRIVSVTNNIPIPIIIPEGVNATLVIPPIIKASKVVVGAVQAGYTEQTVSLNVGGSYRFRQRSGVIVPIVLYGQRAI